MHGLFANQLTKIYKEKSNHNTSCMRLRLSFEVCPCFRLMIGRLGRELTPDNENRIYTLCFKGIFMCTHQYVDYKKSNKYKQSWLSLIAYLVNIFPFRVHLFQTLLPIDQL